MKYLALALTGLIGFVIFLLLTFTTTEAWVWRGPSSWMGTVGLLGIPLLLVLLFCLFRELNQSESRLWDGAQGTLKSLFYFGLLGVFSHLCWVAVYGSIHLYPKLYAHPDSNSLREITPSPDSLDRLAVLGIIAVAGVIGMVLMDAGSAVYQWRRRKAPTQQVST
jgi:hypothetical protein